MKDENKRADIALKVLAILAVLFLIWGATACKSVYVPVVETHTKDSVRIDIRVDTFYQHTLDSIRIQLPCNDSISVAYVERWHLDTIREKIINQDTVYVDRLDSTPQIVEVEKVVTENSKFARFCIGYFFITLSVILVTIGLYFVMKYFLRLHL